MATPETLFVAGMNHRTAPVEVREQLALEEEKIREILADLSGRGVLDEVMIVSTCNRVEVYGVAAVPGEARSAAFGRLGGQRGLAWRELEPLVYTVTGEEAARHAFRVAASLDSMVLGEPQILGQVKDAFALAQSAGTAGPVLHALMSQAFGAAKRVRTETEIGRLAVSVSYAAVELARKIFDGLEGRAVLLVGAGEMGELAARHLVDQGALPVYVTNRTSSRAQELARGLSTPIALLLVVLQSRFLAPEGRGTFVLVVLTITILSRLLGQIGVAVVNRMRAGELELRGLVHRALAAVVVLGAAGTGLAVVGARVAGQVDFDIAVIGAVALVPNLVWQTISGVLLGQARVRLWNYVQALSPLLTLVLMLVFVVGLDGGVRAAVAAWMLAHAGTALFALVAARDVWLPVRGTMPFDAHGLMLLRLALVMGAVQVANLVSYRVELFLLDAYEGVGEVGIYSIAMQAAEALWLIPAAIATASTAPAVHADEADARRLIWRGALRGLALTGAVAVVVGVAAPFLIPGLFGEDFEDAAAPLAVLLPGAVVYAPVTVLVVYLSVRHGRPRLSLAVSVVAMVVTVACAVVFIPAWGGVGAAAASSVGYAAGAALAWVFFARLARGTVAR